MGRAQDAAIEQRFNELSGRIDSLREEIDAQRRQISELNRQLGEAREKLNRPTPNYAVHDDLKRVADAVEKMDKARIDDNRKIHAELERLVRIINTPPPVVAPPPRPRPTASTVDEPADKPSKSAEKHADKPQDYFEYEVKSGDTLDGIVQAYRQQLKIKLTRAQVLKANPGLTPEKIIAGRKIRIPAPAAQ